MDTWQYSCDSVCIHYFDLMGEASSNKAFLQSQGFLMEGKLLQPLVPMKKREQTVVKLSSLLTVS